MLYRRLRSLFVYALILLVLCACARSSLSSKPVKSGDLVSAEENRMPRADPAYLQYLERNSMLAKSAEMAKIVSGSELAWRPSSNDGTPDSLLNFAGTWLAVHPLTVLTSSRSTVFSQLADSSLRPVLREVGVKGLYVAPIQGGGALWASKESDKADTGEDIVQYEFSRVAGKDEHYRRLMGSIIDSQSLLGSDLVPAATGVGPDFFLAARNVREYPGIYCLVDIPEELWPSLPAIDSEWDSKALSPEQINTLNGKGLLPRAMRDEDASGGWAATGKVRGIDGNTRRWVYRYHLDPRYPVLNWEDPSQTAHRILSGSAVRQVGLQGQSLIGLRFEALQGLEASATANERSAFNLEPALTAARSMGREIRRYGGWAWLRDELPLDVVSEFSRSETAFVTDSAFSPAAEHALLTGDATLARFMADELLRLRIDSRRLVHTMPSQEGVSYALPHLRRLAAGAGGKEAGHFRQRIQQAMLSAAARGNARLARKDRLYTSAAGIASLALDLPSASAGQSRLKDIIKGHSLLIFFKAMQPGVLMLSGQDLVGLMPLEGGSPADAVRGSYALSASGNSLVVTNMGMAKAPQMYETPDVQVHQKDSFLARIGRFLRAREECGLAKGTLIARPRTRGKGSIALLSRLPDGKTYLLSVCNFSRKSVSETISLSGIPGIDGALARVTPIATGGKHSIAGRTVSVQLGPWQGRALLIGSSGKKVLAVEAEDEDVTPIPEE